MAILSPKPGTHVAPVVLGVDPGSRVTGFGLITQVGTRLIHVWSGAIETARNDSFEARLDFIHKQISSVILNGKPNVMAIESAFFGKNIQSTIALSHARGVILLAAAQAGIPIVEYSPMEVKKSVVGVGRASKEQVQQMIGHLLPNRKAESGDRLDTSDALAVALCHLNHSSTHSKIEKAIAKEDLQRKST